jgi:tetratricopeptide (TPR) repeat protein
MPWVRQNKMKDSEEAAILDRADRPLEAAESYERAIRSDDADLDTYLNLAVLYFVCTDFGYASHHRLPNEFETTAWDKANEILTAAESRFGKEAEIDFWRYYFRYVVLGDEPFVETCRQLAPLSSSLVPYFYLFVSPGGREYQREAEELFKAVKDGTTAKKRYIRSILKDRLPPSLSS